MDTKQIKLSLLILFGLIVLSYGFLIYAQENTTTTTNIFTSVDDMSPNLTKAVAQQVSSLTNNTSADSTPEVTLDSIKNIVDSSLQGAPITLPEFTRADIKVKKQDYSRFSATVIAEKEKADAIAYAAGLFYIFNSNSPTPVNSLSDMPSMFSSLTTKLIPAITTGDISYLNQLGESGEKMLEQMKEIEVPEKFVDTHIKGMQFAAYATTLKTTLAADQSTDDPLGTLSNLSKVSGFLESLMSFSMEASQSLQTYIPEGDTTMFTQLEKFGINAPTTVSPASENK